MELLNKEDAPSWFDYPAALRRIVGYNLTHLHPWLIMSREQALSRIEGMGKRYPSLEVVPFARRLDRDDVACFEKGSPESVAIIHDFSSAGWERRQVYPSFKAWFRAAVEDMLDFEP